MYIYSVNYTSQKPRVLPPQKLKKKEKKKKQKKENRKEIRKSKKELSCTFIVVSLTNKTIYTYFFLFGNSVASFLLIKKIICIVTLQMLYQLLDHVR
jgi:hypothetical protein